MEERMNTRVGVIAEDAAGQWTGGTAPPLLRAGWLARGAARERWVGAAIALGLAVKLVLEQPWGPALQTVQGLDFPLAPWAHLCGAGAGLLAWAGSRIGRHGT
jgi:hypothetical protein